MLMIIDRRSVKVFACLVLYRIFLDIVYVNIINPVYFYAGFLDKRTTTGCFVSWIIFFIFYHLSRGIIYNKEYRISSIIVSILFLVSFIPFTSCIYMGVAPGIFILWNCIYWMVLLIFERYILSLDNRELPELKMNSVKVDDKFVIIVGLLSLTLVMYISGVYTHFRLNFDLFNVYGYRLEARDFNMPTILRYLFAWTKGINTLMLAYCIIKKKFLMSICYFAVQMLSFGIDGSKATFFLPFLVIIVVLVSDKLRNADIAKIIVYGLTLLPGSAIVEFIVSKTSYISTLFIRRMFFEPNLIHTYYYDFFSKNTPDFFRGSVLRILGFESPYIDQGGAAYAIGRAYYNSATMNCNNGLISDAISNLGILGIIIMPLLMVAFLRLFDRSTFGLDKRLTLTSGVYIAIMLLSTSLTTVLFTHGLLILIILTWLMNPDDINNDLDSSTLTESINPKIVKD